jgi:hypothetical protein
MDGFERHQLDAEIEDDHGSDPFGIDSDRSTQMLFSRKMRSSERIGMNFEVFISVNHSRVAFSRSDREHEDLGQS